MTAADASSELLPAVLEDPRLAKLKQLIASNLPHAACFDDLTLLRFLVAEKNDAAAAVKRLASFVAWRQKDSIDSILQTFEFPEREAFLQIYPQGFHQTDVQGRPVYVQQIGVVNHSALQRLITDERMLRYHIHEMERFVRVICPACSRAAGRHVTQMLSIIDVGGLSFMDLGKVKRLLGLYMQVDAQFYPETLGRLLIINAPSWFASSFQLVKQFMDPNTQAKVAILGSSYQQELLAHVEPHHLLAEYGGRSRSKLSEDVGPWSDACFAFDTRSSTAAAGSRAAGVEPAAGKDASSAVVGIPANTTAVGAQAVRRESDSSGEFDVSSSEGGAGSTAVARAHRASLSISIPQTRSLGQVVPVAAGAAAAAGQGAGHGSLASPFAQAQQQDSGILDQILGSGAGHSSSASALHHTVAVSRRSASGRRSSSGAAGDAALGQASVPLRSAFHSTSSNHSGEPSDSASGFQTPLATFQSGAASPSAGGFSGYATPRAAFTSGLATPSSPSTFFSPRASAEVHSSMASTPHGMLQQPLQQGSSWRQAPLVQMMHTSFTLAATAGEQQRQGQAQQHSGVPLHALASGGQPLSSCSSGFSPRREGAARPPAGPGRGSRSPSNAAGAAAGGGGLPGGSRTCLQDEGSEDAYDVELGSHSSSSSQDEAVSSCCISLRSFRSKLAERRAQKYVPLDTIDCAGEDEELQALGAEQCEKGVGSRGRGLSSRASLGRKGWSQQLLEALCGSWPRSPKQRLLMQQQQQHQQQQQQQQQQHHGLNTWWQWIKQAFCCADTAGW